MSAIKTKKKSKSLLSRAIDVSDIPSYHAALYYGESGTGKTTVAATYPKPILLLDLREHGTETIRKVSGVKALRIDSWQQYERIYWELEEDDTYNTIVHDQISALQSMGIDHIRKEQEMDPEDTFSQRDWGKLSGLMQTWLLNHRNLSQKGKNIVFIAHQRTFNSNEDEGSDSQMSPHIGARLSPSIESFLNGAVSVIGNTFIQEKWVRPDPKKPAKKRVVKYCMRIGPHGAFRTKIRKPPEGEVPDVLVNPTYEKIMSLTRGEGVPTKKVRK